MSSKRKQNYEISEESEDESEESSGSKQRQTHTRTNTQTKLNSSEVQVSMESSEQNENSSEINEHESSKSVVEAIAKKHTMHAKNEDHKTSNGGSPKKEKKKVNSLLGAISRRKAATIREMNAAQNKIPDREEVEFSEATGLSPEQQELLAHTKCLYRYNDGWRVYWDMFVMVLAVWNCFIIPVEIAFTPPEFESAWFLVINSLIDVMFAVDIFVVFRTTYVDEFSGEEVLDGKKIACRYVSGRFWIDLLATIPFDTIGELLFSGNTSYLQAFGILKLVRITRLGRIISYLNVAEDTKIILKLAKLIFFLMMYIHLIGCIWFYMVDADKEWIPPLDYVYVTSDYFQDNTHYQYWMAVYHSVLVLTGNDIGPRFKTIQVVFCAVFVTFGAIVNAYIFGELVVLVAVMNAKTAQFVEKLDTCNTAMENQKLSRDLRTEVVGYLAYTRAMLDSQQELETFLSLVSPSIKEKIIKEIFSDVLSKNKIFKNRDQLIESLTRKLITKIYQPEEIIINQGEDSDKIFFISSGGSNVYVRNRYQVKKKVNALAKGDLFGEVGILNYSKRTATVKASNYSTIAHIDKDTFYRLFSKNMDAMKDLKEKRKEYQDEYKLFIKDNLRYIDYIKNVSEETIENLTYHIKEETYEAESILFKSGSHVDKVIFIADGEVDIVVKVGKNEALLDTLYQACNIGEYGVLGDYTHTFSAKAKTNVSIMYITKESMQMCRDKFADLRKESDTCIDYLENSGLPLVDFRLYRNLQNKSNTVEVLKLAVARIMRINEALDANYSPEEITELLRAVQIRMAYENENNDHQFQKNTNKLLHDVLTRLHQMQMQSEEQRNTISFRIAKIEKDISSMKSEITGKPMSYKSSKQSEAPDDEDYY